MNNKIWAIVLGLALTSGVSTAWAVNTVTYKGTGTFVATRVALPLANGGAAIHLTNDIVATIEPSQTGFIYGDCAGLGYLSAEAEYSVDAYCSFIESAADGFEIKAKLAVPAGGTVEIIGGRGKWADATGTGTIKPKHIEGSRGTYDYEFEITTP